MTAMPNQTAAPKVELRDVHKAFGPKKVLQGVNLSVAKGESLVIIGGSGTGKSVAIKTILGLLTPDSGAVLIDGEDVTRVTGAKRDEINSQTGMLFQMAALFDSLPIWENVAFAPLSDKKVARRDAKDLAAEKLRLVGLGTSVLDRYPADLSSGMQKRVGLARAIANDPEIILFDEPTTGLDPIMADVINNLIVAVNKEVGATALTITHDMGSAVKIGDRVAMIYQGKVVWAGPASDVKNTGVEVVDQFVQGRTDGPIQMAVRA